MSTQTTTNNTSSHHVAALAQLRALRLDLLAPHYAHHLPAPSETTNNKQQTNNSFALIPTPAPSFRISSAIWSTSSRTGAKMSASGPPSGTSVRCPMYLREKNERKKEE